MCNCLANQMACYNKKNHYGIGVKGVTWVTLVDSEKTKHGNFESTS